LFVPREIVGLCFLGFAIGESLGASALRIAGGIFTKIADIGSDLMKIVFNVKEDDPRNPGVIADCTGDNAGDSVGPTADGFETYGVTGVALIAFITLAIPTEQTDLQAKLIVWLFACGSLWTSCLAFRTSSTKRSPKRSTKASRNLISKRRSLGSFGSLPILCITTSYGMSWLLIGDLVVGGKAMPQLWWQLATIIGCGTLAAVLIPEFTKIFTSSHSKHVHEIVTASREGGPSLTILSGLVAGNFSAFLERHAHHWPHVGRLLRQCSRPRRTDDGDIARRSIRWGSVRSSPSASWPSASLCMGPVNIAVDSYGPVTDNAQSIFELAQTEQIPGIHEADQA
jgi:K(+)-stimulated pyrophosphate-energized sodium pump